MTVVQPCQEIVVLFRDEKTSNARFECYDHGPLEIHVHANSYVL